VTGTDIVWLLAPRAANDPAYADATERARAHQAGPIEAVGTVAAPTDPSQPEVLVLEGLKAVGK
jgi:hypothetical protein